MLSFAITINKSRSWKVRQNCVYTLHTIKVKRTTVHYSKTVSCVSKIAPTWISWCITAKHRSFVLAKHRLSYALHEKMNCQPHKVFYSVKKHVTPNTHMALHNIRNLLVIYNTERTTQYLLKIINNETQKYAYISRWVMFQCIEMPYDFPHINQQYLTSTDCPNASEATLPYRGYPAKRALSVMR